MNEVNQPGVLDVIADLHAYAMGSLEAPPEQMEEAAAWLKSRLDTWKRSTPRSANYDAMVFALAHRALREYWDEVVREDGILRRGRARP